MGMMRSNRLYPPAQSLAARRPFKINGQPAAMKATPGKRKPGRGQQDELPLWRVRLPNGVAIGVFGQTKSEARARAKVVLKLERLPVGTLIWLAGEGGFAE